MSLAGLDMNLIIALHALLAERNVTRAGQRIGLSQPATSAALARLRRHFGDELLTRKGSGYELTALGAVLLDRTEIARDMLEQVFGSQPYFDPEQEDREFVILASDYAVTVFGAELAREISVQAPQARISFRQPSEAHIDDPAGHLSTVDGLLMPHGIVAGLPAVELFRDRWVCAVAEDNPEVGESITLSQLATLPWAAYQRAHAASVIQQLSLLGIEPRVQVLADSFQLLPSLVAGTRRVAMIQELLAARLGLGPGSGVRLLDCPFDAVPVREALWWHPVHTHDAGHVWLRELASAVAAKIGTLRSFQPPALHPFTLITQTR
ncbi:MAG TPA: LysR family transcriptional regulator [Streptosporangiaceae bacterium]|nr:LysR family transcriptional regulator [Streptosporangiaceae bacterium]